MNYQPQYQPSPYMQQRQRPQGLLGSSIQQAQPLDQGLLTPPPMPGRNPYLDEPDAPRVEGEPARFLDPFRNAMNAGAAPIRQAVQPVQQGMNYVQDQAQQFQQAAQNQFQSMMPQEAQPQSFTGMQGGQTGQSNPRQQMLMQMLKTMFMGG